MHSRLIPSRLRKFLSYYEPYLGLLSADLLCAVIVAAITLTLPLCARSITDSIVTLGANEAILNILNLGSAMLGLVVLHTVWRSKAEVKHRQSLSKRSSCSDL